MNVNDECWAGTMLRLQFLNEPNECKRMSIVASYVEKHEKIDDLTPKEEARLGQAREWLRQKNAEFEF